MQLNYCIINQHTKNQQTKKKHFIGQEHNLMICDKMRNHSNVNKIY